MGRTAKRAGLTMLLLPPPSTLITRIDPGPLAPMLPMNCNNRAGESKYPLPFVNYLPAVSLDDHETGVAHGRFFSSSPCWIHLWRRPGCPKVEYHQAPDSPYDGNSKAEVFGGLGSSPEEPLDEN